MSVQNNIKRVRKIKGVSQKSVADFIGMSEMTYSRLENTNKKMDPEDLIKIANFLNVGIEIFFSNKLTDSVCRSFKEVTT